MIKKLSLIILLSLMLSSCADNKGNITKSIASPTKSDVKGKVLKVPTAVDEGKIANLPKFPDKIKTKDEILPKGWKMLDILENDFNSDGLSDIVGVIEHPYIENEIYPRIIFVYMNNGNGYNRNMVNQYLIRNRDEGGVMGDPYQPLTAKKNTFTTHTFGGSGWKWNENYTFNYINGKWFLLYQEYIGGYGPFETSYLYDDYKIGVGKRRYTEESPEKENPRKLEFTVKLDKPPLLTDFAYNNCNNERIKAPVIKSFGYNEGVPHFEGDMPPLNPSSVSYENKDYVVYKINQSEKIAFLGVYNYAKNHLQVIARYSIYDNNISDFSCKIYKNRLYFQEEITKMVNVRTNGEIKKRSEIVGVQLVSMNLDGSDKKVVFKAYQSKYKENEIIDDDLDYMTLDYEIIGDEIIVEVYGGNVFPYYRMNLDGGNRKLIGSVPRGAW